MSQYRIVHTTDRWYLVAWDTERDAWRTLRIDRVRAAVIERRTFTPREIPDDALRAFTTRSITTSPYRFRARVRVFASAETVTREFGPTIAQVEPETEDTCILEPDSYRALPRPVAA